MSQSFPMRGNVDTRLRRCTEGTADAVVLARAGLTRLGTLERATETLDEERCIPAPGQGALGIEVRGARADVTAALAPLSHQSTWLCVAAERAVSRSMGGSCSMPLAAHAHFDGEYLQLSAAWGDPERPGMLVRVRSAEVVADLAEANAVGEHVAARLRAGGAG